MVKSYIQRKYIFITSYHLLMVYRFMQDIHTVLELTIATELNYVAGQ